MPDEPPKPTEPGIPQPGEGPEQPPASPPDSETSKADRLTPAGSLRETLKAFGALLDDPPPDSAGTPEEEPAAPPGAESADDRSAAERPAPREIDVAQRLADVVEQIDFKNVPLIDFLDSLSEYSTIPMTLDPDVLPWLRVTPETPVAIQKSKASVDGILSATLNPLGLGFVVSRGQVLVTRGNPAGLAVREVSFDVSDLVEGDAGRMEQLRGLISDLIAPDTWSTAGGPGKMETRDGKLVVTEREVVLFQVLAFCEKLRVARGLPPKGKFDRAMFELTPRTERVQSLLGKTAAANFIRPTRLSQVVRELSKETGASLLIDWQSLSEAGWSPDTELRFVSKDQPLADVLRALLDPLKLTYRVVDGTTLQIVRPLDLDRRVELEFYAVPDLLAAEPSGETLLGRMKSQLGAAALREQGGPGVLRFDPESRSLLAALPQPQQRVVGELLAQLRSSAPKP